MPPPEPPVGAGSSVTERVSSSSEMIPSSVGSGSAKSSSVGSMIPSSPSSDPSSGNPPVPPPPEPTESQAAIACPTSDGRLAFGQYES